MGSPISTTRRTRRSGCGGFTLAEVMIAGILSTVILGAAFSTFLLILRTEVNATNYSDLEVQARKALELLGREVRMAITVENGFSDTSLTLDVTDSSAVRTSIGYRVTYAIDTANNVLTRRGPPPDNPGGAVATTVLVSGVQPIPGVANFHYFNYYRNVTDGYLNGFQTNTAVNETEVRQIEVNFVAQRAGMTVAKATNKVLSARFILRNH